MNGYQACVQCGIGLFAVNQFSDWLIGGDNPPQYVVENLDDIFALNIIFLVCSLN